MLKVKSETWTNSHGKRFVVLPEDEFARLTELAEDAGLARILRKAKANDSAEAGIPFAEVKRQLAARARRKSKS
jgi:hypothetical protein